MAEEKKIKKVTSAVACVVAGKNCKIGEDVTVSPEDGMFLVGAKRAVIAGTAEAEEIKKAAKKAA